MKKKKLLRAMELADEKFVAEADPEKQFNGAKIENKVIDPKKKIRKLSVIAACVAVAMIAINLALFIPYGTTPPSVARYAGSEYYDIIEKLNVITFKKPDYKNNFEYLASGVGSAFKGAAAEDAAGDAPNAAPPTNSGSTVEGGYVEVTDNQVSGVTEADRIKRSDKYIYYLCDYNLYVYSIDGESSELVGVYSVTGLDRGYSNEWDFYLSKDCSTVTLVAPSYNTELNTSCVNLFSLDVTDPSNITEKARFSVTGGLVSTRVVDGKMLLVSNFKVLLDGGSPDFDNEFSFLPAINKGKDFEVLPVEDIITPDTLTSARYTVICKLDELTLEFEDATALLSYSEEIYVSKDKIFATHGYRDVVNIDGGEVNRSVTDISAISYRQSEMNYLGTATVEGYIKDQYSLDEHEGMLRVVTTTDSYLQRVTDYNFGGSAEDSIAVSVSNLGTNANLYIINLDDYKVIASVESFAPRGETVKSVRFDGTDAYVCTAIERKDPVFFFDLSDVNNITYKETGTIEGFSTSLVNLGEGYLLGIGTGSSWASLKIEIYEEVKDGVESVAAFELENTYYSEDYKAYYIDRENNMVGLGIETYANSKYDYDYSRYILLQFDGYKIHEILNERLGGGNDDKRGVLIDGYFYMFGGEDFKVVAIG